MKRFLSLLGVAFLLAITLASCVTTSEEQIESADILGQWTLKEAFRENKPTSTLESVYFNFDENGQVATNFNLEGEEQSLTYEVNDGEIQMKGANNLYIKARKNEKGDLEFKTTLMDFDFKLILEPKKED